MAGIYRLKAQELPGLEDGTHGDGGNLYVRVRNKGKSKTFVFIYRAGGRQRLMGLGKYDPNARTGITLAQARDKADELRRKLRDDIDPLEEQREVEQRTPTPTFSEYVATFLDTKEGGWKNDKHRAQWRMTLRVYAGPLKDIPVDQVATSDVLKCLTPIWTTKNETARRTRGRIQAVLDAARAEGKIPTDAANPARYEGHLKLLLPTVKPSDDHHAALPYEQVPQFFVELRNRRATSANALEFLILTAARVNEVIELTWPEINLDAKLWTVPADRMKAEMEHLVPLPDRAIQVLKAMQPLATSTSSGYAFPGARKNKGLSNMAFAQLLVRMKRDDITPHGVRSSFSDWCGEETEFSEETREFALAHVIGDKAKKAYRRMSAVKKRRALMDAWATYCGSADEAASKAEKKAA